MKKILILGLYGVIILSASAGASWFLHSKHKAEIDEANKPTDVLTQSAGELASPVNVTRPLKGETEADLPVAVRPGEMSVEEIVRYGLGLKDRETQIRAWEEALQRKEDQYRLLQADISDEKLEIGGLVAQARDQRIASEKLLAQAQQERIKSDDSLKQLKEEIQKQEIERERAARNPAEDGAIEETKVDHEANVKDTATMLAGMEPEQAADVIRGFANDGEFQTVVELLATLEERAASEIMGTMAVEDEELAYEIATKMMKRERTVKVAKKKR